MVKNSDTSLMLYDWETFFSTKLKDTYVAQPPHCDSLYYFHLNPLLKETVIATNQNVKSFSDAQNLTTKNS